MLVSLRSPNSHLAGGSRNVGSPRPQTDMEAGGQPWGPGVGAPLNLSGNNESPVCATWSTDGFLNGQPQIQPSAQCRPRVGAAELLCAWWSLSSCGPPGQGSPGLESPLGSQRSLTHQEGVRGLGGRGRLLRPDGVAASPLSQARAPRPPWQVPARCSALALPTSSERLRGLWRASAAVHMTSEAAHLCEGSLSEEMEAWGPVFRAGGECARGQRWQSWGPQFPLGRVIPRPQRVPTWPC